MTLSIENEYLKAVIAERGAELQSLKSLESGKEYIWEGNPDLWGKHAPILFPIVGALKDDKYFYQGNEYSMPKHGLARINDFEVIKQETDKVSLVFQSSAETLKQYPFEFEFIVHYQLIEKSLLTTFEIVNKSNGRMFYSVGGHPAFKIPMEGNESFTDYHLNFEHENLLYNLPMKGNYVNFVNKQLQAMKNIVLDHKLFKNDVLVYESQGKNRIILENQNSTNRVTISYSNLPYFGLWTTYPKSAEFLCVEPWAGLPDDVNTSGNLTEKRGILTLEEGKRNLISFNIEIA